MSLDDDLKQKIQELDPDLLKAVEDAIAHVSLISKSTDTLISSTGVTQDTIDFARFFDSLRKSGGRRKAP